MFVSVAFQVFCFISRGYWGLFRSRYCICDCFMACRSSQKFHFGSSYCRRFHIISKRRLVSSLYMSVCLSVHMEQLVSHWTDYMKFEIWEFFQNLPRKFKFHQNLTRIKCTLYEDLYTFMIIFRSNLLRMRNISDKI